MALQVSGKLKYVYLHEYANYLQDNHLDDFTEDALSRASNINLPLLKLFAGYPREKLLGALRKKINGYLISIYSGTTLDEIIEEDKAWARGELPNVSKEQVQLTDIIFSYTVLKQSFMGFIKYYTTDINTYETLSFELEDLFTKISKINCSSYMVVQNELMLKERDINEKIIDFFVIGVVVLKAIRDEDGNIKDFKYLMINKAGRKMLNWEIADISGLRLLEEFPGTKSEGIFDKYKDVVENDVHFDLEFFYPHENFKKWIKQSGMKWKDGLLITTIDITEQKQNEQAIKLLNSELEDRVKERTNELEIKNNELIKTNKDLDTFIYTVSHDLKSPVSNIDGLITALGMVLEDNDIKNKEIDQILDLVNVSINKFQNTLRELTEIIKFQKITKEELEDISLHGLIEDVKTNIRNMILETGAEIKEEFPLDSTLKFSQYGLRSILFNLISNAIKYRSPERVPQIVVSFYKENGTSILEVKDNGLGIADKNKENIFSLFWRMHTDVEGTGLGLYIVKRIMDNNDGEIEVFSKEGEGSTFKLSFRSPK